MQLLTQDGRRGWFCGREAAARVRDDVRKQLHGAAIRGLGDRQATWEDTGQRGRRAQGPEAGGCRHGDSQERRGGAGGKGQTQVSEVLGPRPPGAAGACPVLTTQTRLLGAGARQESAAAQTCGKCSRNVGERVKGQRVDKGKPGVIGDKVNFESPAWVLFLWEQ